MNVFPMKNLSNNQNEERKKVEFKGVQMLNQIEKENVQFENSNSRSPDRNKFRKSSFRRKKYEVSERQEEVQG
eukprot:CAMPEP_0170564982 /NCGR_PEP_ID=MMETSP0211-20121228/76058_1 /TAXON_ID=311385 /ORGANISM="Pseudokeronopsis sp., Strain OXSARD2" /LENGTH=72 /DNA_ID=CAMNT_0010885173 /DNA_START=18 /DNA_END=236 /DNA_ORIENTATION=+